MAGVIVLDASVLIAYLEGEDEHHEAAEALLAREIDDDFGANPLTLAEVLVGPARHDRLDEVRLALRELEVEELSFPDDTAVKLALLRSETGLKMPNCCALLAAEHVGARLASFDDGLRKAAIKRSLQTVAARPRPSSDEAGCSAR
jgi:predicted nucleic acid-binding protein